MFKRLSKQYKFLNVNVERYNKICLTERFIKCYHHERYHNELYHNEPYHITATLFNNERYQIEKMKLKNEFFQSEHLLPY